MSEIESKRPIPEYLRKCFTSKIKGKIERNLAKAYADGYTKEEIQDALADACGVIIDRNIYQFPGT